MSFLMNKAEREKIIKALNTDIGLEIGAIIQYLHHHFTAEGLESPEIIDEFEDIAKEEMKHMQMLSERVNYLGGTPATKMAPVKIGGNIKKMIQDDLEGEYTAIKTYKGHIKLAADIGDTTTRLMLEQITTDEESHADKWETTLAKRPK